MQLYIKLLTIKNANQKYVSWLNDYEVVKFTEQRFYKHKLLSVKKFIKDKIKSKNEFLYGIFLYKKEKKETYHIGNIKLGPINFIHKYAEISYFIGDKSFWNKGYATKAIKKIIHIAKKKYRIKKLIAGCYENNIGSIKALKKNFFLQEGKLRSHFIFEKKRCNSLIFGRKI